MSVVAATIGVREAYELWAPSYARETNPLLLLQERWLEPLIPPLRGRRVVDVACGTGRWLSRLAGRGAQWAVGLDLSLPMLCRAKAQVANPLICADGCALPLRDGCADVVLCSLALDHVSNLAALIYELARVTADAGMLLLSDFHPDAHARGWKRRFRAGETTIELPVYPRHLSTLHQALRFAGFSLDLCEEPGFSEADRYAFQEAGREDLFEAAAGAGPALYVARYMRQCRANQVAVVNESLTMRSASVARSAKAAARADVTMEKGVFTRIGARPLAQATVDLAGYMLLPGLVNAHDHLEFSLFPRLGAGPYANVRDWARDIYRPQESPVREHRTVPKEVRLWWGALKNLLCGVTTVSHHNPYAEVFADPDFPVRVVRHYGWAHSFAEEPDVRSRFDGTPAGSPFFMHLGEGTDEEAAAEFDRLASIGPLAGNTVLVHGVAMDDGEHRRLQECGGAIVWCPSSNLFLLGQTLSRSELARASRIALGSDSSISGAGDLLDEIRIAHEYGVSPERIFSLVTGLAANVLNEGAGAICAGLKADLVAVRDLGLSPAETLCRASHAEIELVIVGGKLRLISEEILERWNEPLPGNFEPLIVEGVKRYVAAPVARLLEEARRHLGSTVRLGGKRVWQ